MTKSPLLLLLLLCASCRTLFGPGPDGIGGATLANAGRHIELAETEAAAGKDVRSLKRLVKLLEVKGLPPGVRDRTSNLLEHNAEETIERYSTGDYDSDDLLDLYNLGLPPRLRSRAGTLAAERRYEEGYRVGAFALLKKVEDELPSHPERAFAADLLARVGLDLAADSRRYNLLFRYRTRGVEALEYLVLTYPFDKHCAEAYDTLARIYEDRGSLDRAVARYEDLIVYHPQSPYSARARWRLPVVRMKRIERDDYDRSELVLAARELQDWLGRHAGNELQPKVEADLASCRTRLAESDLILARYYRRIREPFGARLHAERALQVALAAGAAREEKAARAILASLTDLEPERTRATEPQVLEREGVWPVEGDG